MQKMKQYKMTMSIYNEMNYTKYYSTTSCKNHRVRVYTGGNAFTPKLPVLAFTPGTRLHGNVFVKYSNHRLQTQLYKVSDKSILNEICQK